MGRLPHLASGGLTGTFPTVLPRNLRLPSLSEPWRGGGGEITCRALLPAFPCLEHSPLLCTLARACRSLRCFRSLRPGTHASSLSLGSLVLHNENMPHLLDLHQTSPLAETLLDSPFLFSFRMVSPSSFTIKEGFRS